MAESVYEKNGSDGSSFAMMMIMTMMMTLMLIMMMMTTLTPVASDLHAHPPRKVNPGAQKGARRLFPHVKIVNQTTFFVFVFLLYLYLYFYLHLYHY